MNGKKVFLILLILMLVISTLVFLITVKAPTGTNLYASPTTKTLGLTPPLGETYTFDVILENASDVVTIGFDLSFDTSKVNITNIMIGDALPGGGLLIGYWDAAVGYIDDVCVSVFGVSYDVDNKTVATVTVEALDVTGPGGTVVDILGMSCWDDTLFEFLSGDSPYDHTLYTFRAYTNLYTSPATKTLGPKPPPLGGTYTFDVMLENAINVTTICFDLSFDPSKVNITDIMLGDALGNNSCLLIGNWYPATGYIDDICVSVLETSYDVDNKTVVTVTVEVTDFTGEEGTVIDLCNMSCWDVFLNEFLSGDSLWDHKLYAFKPDVHDVAVIDIRPLETVGYVGDVVSIEVDVQNQGDLKETFNVTVYADVNTTVIGDEVVIDTETITLRSFRFSHLTFNWDTLGLASGNYTLTAIADTLPEEVDIEDNTKTNGIIQLFETGLPCSDIEITCPTNITVNPSIFTFNAAYQARLINIGNVVIKSTGFEGHLRILGSKNGTIRLCVNQPDLDFYTFNLPLYGEVQVPIWLMFQPETHWGGYYGTFTLRLTICGTHRRQLTIVDIGIDVCQNGAYIVNDNTVTFTWTLTGGSWVYLEAEADLPSGWSYNVDPAISTLFETPHDIIVNITAPADAKEGEMGKVTLRAYKNATDTMFWQFIYFASTDNNPPTIESIETPILSLDGNLFFNTSVKDPSGIDNVELYYSVDGGPWENETMDWASGDTFNSTQYTYQKLFGTDPKTIQYYMMATDWFGNQTQSEVQTITIMNDIAITEAAASKTVIGQGYEFTVNLTISNQGSLPLSFVNLAIYANSTLLEMQSLGYILNGTSTTLNLAFNTTSLQKGNYVIAAYALCSNDTDNTDNVRSVDLVLTILGDFSGDFEVGPYDFALLGVAYGSTPWTPGMIGDWNPNCDANGSNKVDPADFAILGVNYGNKYP